MLKQSPSRNQKSKGFSVKHNLKQCLLLGVATWLFYRVNHTHARNMKSEDSSKLSENVRVGFEMLKLSRKTLNPRIEEAAAENLRHRDEEELKSEDIESKQEEDEYEERVGGDREKVEDEETEQLDDWFDEDDKEREEVSEQKERETRKEDGIDDLRLPDQYGSDVVHNTQIVSSGYEVGAFRAAKEEEIAKNVARNESYLEAKKSPLENYIGRAEEVSELNLEVEDDGSQHNSSMRTAGLNQQ